ncbi:MAG: HypC/HybG/HupF family hydrogenase formation chaperone [Planctomycetota bacterium]
MCLGVPGQVIERDGNNDEFATAVVDFAGLRRRVSAAFVPEAKPGDYVIVHAGVAISLLDEVEAIALLERMDALESGNSSSANEAFP